jgi:hypothetical protein
MNIINNCGSYKSRIHLCCRYMPSWHGHGRLYFTYTNWSLEFSESKVFGMMPSGWRFGFLHTLAVTHITLSSVKLCISLSEVDYIRALWNETLLQSCNVCYGFICICVCVY